MNPGSDFRDNLVKLENSFPGPSGASCIGERTQVPAKKITPGRVRLERWLHSSMKIEMTDGRTLIGIFMCTDRDNNIILGSCTEYLKSDDGGEDEPRVLGLAMVPGRHIVTICIDDSVPPPQSPIFS